jgi:TolB-like protein/Flp pilus assembly protein TadD
LIYNFDDCSLDVDRQELRRGGALVEIEPQVLDLLQYLIRNRERIVSKDDLIANVWKGRVVSDSTLTSRITSARQAIGDSGDHQRLIRTIARKGVRFVGDVDETRASRAVHSENQTSTVPRLPDKPSIAVLPFINMSGDPEQDYFTDGIAEDVITALSKLRWFFVISRNSSFSYRGKSIELDRVARELGVRYVLEGSVRKRADQVRITAQLIDASSGNHIWADHYDGELREVFTLQDEITRKVVAAIEPKLLEAESLRTRSRSPDDLDAWETVVHANSLLWRLTKRDGEAAIPLLRKAVKRYPDYGPAHSILAFALLMSGYLGWDLMEPQTDEAFRLATRAAELDNNDPWAHLALGYVALTLRRTDEAVEEFQRAIDINPNFSTAHGYLADALSLDGQSERAILCAEQAIRMSPHDPQNAIFNMSLATAHYLAGRYDEAVGYGRKAVQLRHGMTGGHRIYIASLAQAGRIHEARVVLGQLRKIQPDISISWIRTHVPYTPGPMEHFLEGIRKAGLN